MAIVLWLADYSEGSLLRLRRRFERTSVDTDTGRRATTFAETENSNYVRNATLEIAIAAKLSHVRQRT
jgi:hypothetical protein